MKKVSQECHFDGMMDPECGFNTHRHVSSYFSYVAYLFFPCVSASHFHSLFVLFFHVSVCFSLFCRFSFTIQFSLCFFFLPESLTTACVAFHLILVATTAQLVLELGFSGGDLLWRVLQPAFAEKRADSPTSSQTCTTRVVLKLWDGLSLFDGVQLVVDTTVVSAFMPIRRNAARRDGVAFEAAHQKERTRPELTAKRGRARLYSGSKWVADGRLRHGHS